MDTDKRISADPQTLDSQRLLNPPPPYTSHYTSLYTSPYKPIASIQRTIKLWNDHNEEIYTALATRDRHRITEKLYFVKATFTFLQKQFKQLDNGEVARVIDIVEGIGLGPDASLVKADIEIEKVRKKVEEVEGKMMVIKERVKDAGVKFNWGDGSKWKFWK
jgi:hypothetical protein